MTGIRIYGAGVKGRLLHPDYDTPRTHNAIDRRHERQARILMTTSWEGYEISLGVQQALQLPLMHAQRVNKYPWAVVWFSTKRGKYVRRLHESLASAIMFHRSAARVDPHATIISRQRGYDIPPSLRGKLPTPWKWCPHCMKPRKYRRLGDRTFYAQVKRWNHTKQRYEWLDRRLALMICTICRCTNRDPVFRRSNQPWELRRFKRGAMRARARHRKPKRIKRRR